MGRTTVPDTKNEAEDEVTQLAEWIVSTAKRLAEDDGCTVCITNIDNDIVVQRIDLSDDVGSIDALASKIYETAAKDAETIGGGNYFVTIDGAEGRHPLMFTLEESSEENGGGEGGSENSRRMTNWSPAGPGGRIPVESWVQFNNQTLKHNEFLFEASIRERSDVFSLFKKQIQEQHETIRFLEKERAKERVLIEELMSAKHMRDMEVAKMEKAESRKDEALGLLKPWAHSVSARLLGPGAVTKDVMPLLDMFEAVFSTFTPEQFQAIMSSDLFSQRQKQELAGIFSTIMNLKEQQAGGGGAGKNHQPNPTSPTNNGQA
jgi:hypothetical protein